MKSLKMGIIGIKGKYGQWFERFLLAQGYSVIGSDLGTTLSNELVVRRSDIVIFCVPIRSAVQIITELLPYSRPGQLWMDITGVKEPAMEAMLQSKAAVLGLHPMCAPSAKTLRGQTLVTCPARLPLKWRPWVKQFLASTEATIQKSTAEEHDRYMAIVQCMAHAISLSMARTLWALEINVGKTMDFTSIFYRIVMGLMGRILYQDPNLYADMQIENRYVGQTLTALAISLAEFKAIVDNKDREGFLRRFETSQGYFGLEQLAGANDFFDDLMGLWADCSNINTLVVIFKDRPGMLKDIAILLDALKLDLPSFHSKKIDGKQVRFLIGLDQPRSNHRVKKAISQIKLLPGVLTVKQKIPTRRRNALINTFARLSR